MEIQETRSEQYVSLRPIGDLDANSSITLDERLHELIEQGNVNILVDCSEVEYISSAGLGVFISYLDEIRSRQGKLVLSNMKENVRDVFDLLGLTRLITIVEDTGEAEKSFEQ